eukprot:3829853-Rhodomonas_salina.3
MLACESCFGAELGSSGRGRGLHEYNIALSTWTDLSSPRNGTIPFPREKMGFGASAGKLYVFGGYAGGTMACPSYRSYSALSVSRWPWMYRRMQT